MTDFDADGKIDTARVSNGEARRVEIAFGRRAQILHAPRAARLIGVTAADIDRDGDPDLVALGASGRLYVWTNRAGVFSHRQDITPSRPGRFSPGGCSNRVRADENVAQPTLSIQKWLIVPDIACPAHQDCFGAVPAPRGPPPRQISVTSEESRAPPFSRSL